MVIGVYIVEVEIERVIYEFSRELKLALSYEFENCVGVCVSNRV